MPPSADDMVLPSDLELRTARTVLRPVAPGDAEALVRVAGARRIADTTISVPHPLGEDDAKAWLARAEAGRRAGHDLGLALLIPALSPELLGYVGLHDISGEHGQAELSFWIDARGEGLGLVSEATRAVIAHAFGPLGLNRLCAFHMVRNAASGRTLERLGFRQEGLLRQRVRKWGVFEDVLAWARLKSDVRRDDGGSGPKAVPA